MLAVSATVTGIVLFEFYRQSSYAQVTRTDKVVDRNCREIEARYASLISF
jgi:hypothetical protein